MYHDIINSRFNSTDGGSYRVLIRSTVDLEDKPNPTEYKFIKDEALTLSCDGELLIDKLHNTRAVVRFYVPYDDVHKKLIDKVFADQTAITVVSIYQGFKILGGSDNKVIIKDNLLYNGFLDTSEVEVYDDNTGNFVMELVFGDLNPLKRIKASLLGVEVSTKTLQNTPLYSFIIDERNMPTRGEFGALFSKLLDYKRSTSLKFETRLAGDDPTLYDVLEVYAEGQAGSIRQASGVLTLIQAPIDKVKLIHYVTVDNIVRGISIAKGKAYNRFVYKFSSASPKTESFKPISVVGGDIYYFGDNNPRYRGGDGSIYDTSYMVGRQGRFDRKVDGRRVSHAYDAKGSYPIVSRDTVAPIVTGVDKEAILLGDVELKDADVMALQIEPEVDKLKAMAKQTRIEAKAIRQKLYSEVSDREAWEILAKCSDVRTQDYLVKYTVSVANSLILFSRRDNFRDEGQWAMSLWKKANDGTAKPQEDKFNTDIDKFIKDTEGWETMGISTPVQELYPEVSGLGIRKNARSEWEPNMVIGSGVKLLTYEGKGVAFTQRFKPAGVGGSPIHISIDGGNYASSDEVRAFLDDLKRNLEIDGYSFRLALEVAIIATNTTTLDTVYWCDNYGEDKSKYDRAVKADKRFEWKPYAYDIRHKFRNYIEMGEFLDSSLSGDLDIYQPDGYDQIEIVLTGKWVAGYKISKERGSQWFRAFKAWYDTILPKAYEEYVDKFSEYSLIRYISSITVEQGESVAYRDRETELTLGSDNVMFDEVLEYDTRIGTVLRSPSLFFNDKGDIVETLISEEWFTMASKELEKIQKHEALVLYSLAFLYGKRYNVVEFNTTNFGASFPNFSDGMFRYIKDGKIYFTEHYEWGVQGGKTKVRGRELPSGDDYALMQKAKEAGDRMWIGNFDKGKGGRAYRVITLSSGRVIMK